MKTTCFAKYLLIPFSLAFALGGCARPAPNDLLRMWPVSKRINVSGRGDDDPSLIVSANLSGSFQNRIVDCTVKATAGLPAVFSPGFGTTVRAGSR